jgi:uncharacterized protein YecT (DUF1311 family)
MQYFGCAAAIALVLAAVAARADCGNGTTDADVKACLSQELRDADQRINAVYKTIMAGREEPGKAMLRDQQRFWLKRRDKACNLDNKEPDREKWLAAILTDQSKTVCVVRYTFARVSELDELLKQAGGASPPDLPAAPQAPKFAEEPASRPIPAWNRFIYDNDNYQLRSNVSHDRGKWYYEIQIDVGRIALLGNVLLLPGYSAVPPAQGGSVNSINIRDALANAPTISIGFAIDLDNGLVNVRVNGDWRQQPGSAGSTEVKLNRSYQTYLEGSSPLDSLIRRELVTINLGEKPFEYALPDGYRPFSQQ